MATETETLRAFLGFAASAHDSGEREQTWIEHETAEEQKLEDLRDSLLLRMGFDMARTEQADAIEELHEAGNILAAAVERAQRARKSLMGATDKLEQYASAVDATRHTFPALVR